MENQSSGTNPFKVGDEVVVDADWHNHNGIKGTINEIIGINCGVVYEYGNRLRTYWWDFTKLAKLATERDDVKNKEPLTEGQKWDVSSPLNINYFLGLIKTIDPVDVAAAPSSGVPKIVTSDWLKLDDVKNKGYEKEFDTVNNPKHYMLFPEKGIEVRDLCKVMAKRLTLNGYDSMFISDYIQFLQYVLRFDQKNGIEDLEKARFYLDKMVEVKEEKGKEGK